MFCYNKGMDQLNQIFSKLIPRTEKEVGDSLQKGHFLSIVEAIARSEKVPEEALYAELIADAIAKRTSTQAVRSRWDELSPREQQVTALACLDYTNRQIGSNLLISSETVKTHMRNVLHKFGLHSKPELRAALADWDFSGWHTPSKS